MSMLTLFNTFVVDRMNVDELVELSAFGHGLRNEYERLGLEVPESVGVQLNSIKRAIDTLNADRNEAELRSAKAQLATLSTAEEKREALRKKIATLEKKVNPA